MGSYRFSPIMGLLLLVMITLSSAMIPERTDEEVRALYDEWRAKHGKLRGERENRFEIFKDNLKYIDQINAQNLPYRLGLNVFADLTNEEYRSMYLRANLGVGSRRNETSSRHQPRLGVDVPDSIDWREKGAVAPIKDQGRCGSCWAFSTIAAVESISQIVTGKLMTLSEQELVSCDTSNHGCNGGNLNRAFRFIINNRGVDTDTDYRYTASDDPCIESKKNTRVVTIDGYVDVPHNNENALKEAAAKQVVSVYIDASGRSFQLYHSGILTGECGTSLNHAVNVVGYGSEGGMDYWIVRNSWGLSWGDSGYIRMQRNIAFRPEGLCGIAMWPSYPIKNGPNPPTVCDEYNSCDAGDTCCCLVSSSNSCLEWGCCPYGYPICDGPHRLCWTGQGKNDLFEVKAMRRTTAAAKPLWAQLGGVGKSCA